MAGEIEFRFCQLGAIGIGLQVEIDRGAVLSGAMSQGRLANLPRAQEGDSRIAVEQFVQLSGNTALYHPCIYGV